MTDGAPALALALDRTPSVMSRGPRDPGTPLLNRPAIAFIVTAGAIEAAFGIAIFVLMPPLTGQSAEETRTAAFLFLGAVQLLFVYPARRADVAPLSNPVLHIAVFLSFALHVAAVTLPGPRDAFQVVLPSAVTWLWAAGGVLAAWLAAEVTRRSIWSRFLGTETSLRRA